MKERLNLWLSQSARFPGLLACGLRYPDHSSFTQQWADGFEPGPIEKSLAGSSELWKLVQLSGIRAQWLRYGFRNGWFYLAQRGDGTFLSLITARILSEPDAKQIDALLRQFLQK